LGFSAQPTRYADFDPDHDKVAKSTLSSLSENANGMHLGLISIAIGLLAKFGKNKTDASA